MKSVVCMCSNAITNEADVILVPLLTFRIRGTFLVEHGDDNLLKDFIGRKFFRTLSVVGFR